MKQSFYFKERGGEGQLKIRKRVLSGKKNRLFISREKERVLNYLKKEEVGAREREPDEGIDHNGECEDGVFTPIEKEREKLNSKPELRVYSRERKRDKMAGFTIMKGEMRESQDLIIRDRLGLVSTSRMRERKKVPPQR